MAKRHQQPVLFRKHILFYLYRPQTKQVSVCPQGVGVHGRGCAWQGGACMAGGMCGGGMCMVGEGGVHDGGMRGRGACMAGEGVRHILRDKINERAVRILLECILVELIAFSLMQNTIQDGASLTDSWSS